MYVDKKTLFDVVSGIVCHQVALDISKIILCYSDMG